MLSIFDQSYCQLLTDILDNEYPLNGRNGRTLYEFGRSVRADLSEGFPLLGLRKLNFEMALEEFLWDISGATNINSLSTKVQKFWSPWVDTNGNLPTSYGLFMRNFPQLPSWAKRLWCTPEYASVIGKEPKSVGPENGVDQLRIVYNELKSNPTSRRLVVSMWHPQFAWGGEIIPACHPMLIFSSDGLYLDLMVVGRSNDMATGFPWDMARYALLTSLFAHCADLEPGMVQFTNANSHIYTNCVEPCLTLLERVDSAPALPKLFINPDLRDPFEATMKDFELRHYEPLEAIRMPFNE